MKTKSIKQIVHEHENVLITRRRLEKMFSMIAECHVSIGGSYMLKYWCEAFSEREVSDYDFILYALPENMQKIESFLNMMAHQTAWIELPKDYDYRSVYLGHCNGLKVNVILKPDKYCPCTNFESLEDIIRIKKAWCDKAIKNGQKPRQKDVDDIASYEAWKAQQVELPF